MNIFKQRTSKLREKSSIVLHISYICDYHPEIFKIVITKHILNFQRVVLTKASCHQAGVEIPSSPTTTPTFVLQHFGSDSLFQKCENNHFMMCEVLVTLAQWVASHTNRLSNASTSKNLLVSVATQEDSMKKTLTLCCNNLQKWIKKTNENLKTPNSKIFLTQSNKADIHFLHSHSQLSSIQMAERPLAPRPLAPKFLAGRRHSQPVHRIWGN